MWGGESGIPADRKSLAVKDASPQSARQPLSRREKFSLEQTLKPKRERYKLDFLWYSKSNYNELDEHHPRPVYLLRRARHSRRQVSVFDVGR